MGAIETILDIWGCIDWEKTNKSRLIGIWDEFTNKVKAAAYSTNSYAEFVGKLAAKMDVHSLRYASINEIMKDEIYSEAVLQVIRKETLVIMLQVRLTNEARKEERQKAMEVKENE